MKPIDDSSLVAVIEKSVKELFENNDKLYDKYGNYFYKNAENDYRFYHKLDEYNWDEDRMSLTDVIKYLFHLNTSEVKEVDLEREINKYISNNFFGSETMGFYANRTKEEPNDRDIALVAKHFFKLGLKAARKDNIRHSMDETPNYPCDILFVTNVDNMFLYRYMENGRPVDKETPYFHNILNGKCWYYCNDIVNKAQKEE